MLELTEISELQQNFNTQNQKHPSTWQLDKWERVEQSYIHATLHNYNFSQREIAALIFQNKTANNKPVSEQLAVLSFAKVLNLLEQQAPQQITKQLLIDIDDILGFKFEMLITNSDENFAHPAAFVAYEKINEFTNALRDLNGEHPLTKACKAHNLCLELQPFNSSNTDIARIIANVILANANYPLLTFTTEQAQNYRELLAADIIDFEAITSLLHQVCADSLTLYQQRYSGNEPKLMRIGEVAKLTTEAVHTIRYWTQLGLIEPAAFTAGGYQLYDQIAITKAKAIREMEQHERLSISEIKDQLQLMY